MTRVFNFSAGPSVLPESVLQQAAAEMMDYQGTGQSVMEMSHRSKAYEAIFYGAEALVREILGVSDDYHVLFLHGGASMQFHMLPLNFMTVNKTADYTLTGTWAVKAAEEAQKHGQVNVVGSSKDKNFWYLPPVQGANPAADYFHICYNNTTEGTQYFELPEVGDVPLIGDISSGILSTPLDVNKFAVLYAGAQKNLGPAGATLVIIRKDMLARIPKNLPTMMDFRTHVEARSMFNTPATYPIYVMKLVLEWIKAQGRETVFQRNRDKAALFYDYLDQSEMFYNPVEKSVRSLMNVPFLPRTTDRARADALTEQFVREATAAGLINLAGHRSTGGMRASIYNAMPIEGIQALVAFMQDFEARNG